MDEFLYDNGLRHERVKIKKTEINMMAVHEGYASRNQFSNCSAILVGYLFICSKLTCCQTSHLI